MPCTCDFRLESGGEVLPLNFELTCELSRLTSGARFYWESGEGHCIDSCGITTIPTETLAILAGILSKLDSAKIPQYDADFDDSPYSLPEQISRLRALVAEAIRRGERLICFGA